jgi:predicted nucleic acid-binding Zn finger protein
MANISESNTFNQICKDIQAAGEMTAEHKTKLTQVFKGRFSAAYNVVKERKVIKYVFHPSDRVLYIVKGKTGDYLILPVAPYCSCPDFYFRVIDHEIAFCYHLMAQKLAAILEAYTVIDECDENFAACMERWRNAMSQTSRSPTVNVEDVRQAVMDVLLTYECLPINDLLERIHEIGFSTLTRRHLANILISDRAKRFRSNDGLWTLSSIR